MGARVNINGKETNVTDQFLRYTFPVEGSVVLEIAFDPSIDTDGRFMAWSGGWDWAPYTETYESHSFSFDQRGGLLPAKSQVIAGSKSVYFADISRHSH